MSNFQVEMIDITKLIMYAGNLISAENNETRKR